MQTQPRVITRPLAQPRTLAVFASAEAGLLPAYEQAAGELGALLAELPIWLLVEGAGSRGVLGAVVAPVLAAGLPVIQVVVGHVGKTRPASQHWVVAYRQQSRQRMLDEADALLFLPGGSECCTTLLEALQARQAQPSAPPVLLYNIAQFLLPLLGLLAHLQASGFLAPGWRQGVWCVDRPRTLLAPIFTISSLCPLCQRAQGERARASTPIKGGCYGRN